eukprot:9439963-Alexandrium_andersonii.AAC.1
MRKVRPTLPAALAFAHQTPEGWPTAAERAQPLASFASSPAQGKRAGAPGASKGRRTGRLATCS